MPRSSLRALEVLLRRLKADEGLKALPEVRGNVLSACRAFQRLGVEDGDQDAMVLRVLIRRDVLVGSDTTTPEAMNLRVRQSEQLVKLKNAQRRAGGNRTGPSALWQGPPKLPPMRRLPGRSEQDEAGDVPAGGEDGNGSAAED
jgi:hypothetical protein